MIDPVRTGYSRKTPAGGKSPKTSQRSDGVHPTRTRVPTFSNHHLRLPIRYFPRDRSRRSILRTPPSPIPKQPHPQRGTPSAPHLPLLSAAPQPRPCASPPPPTYPCLAARGPPPSACGSPPPLLPPTNPSIAGPTPARSSRGHRRRRSTHIPPTAAAGADSPAEQHPCLHPSLHID